MRYFLFILLTMFNAAAHTEEIFPSACKAFVIKHDAVTLPGGAPRLIMLHNLSPFDLWITHTLSGKDNQAPASSRLQPNHWSALALGKERVEISCIESKPGHEQVISCQQALALCEWLPSSRPQKPQGVFFAGEDMSLESLTAYMSRLGFELPLKT